MKKKIYKEENFRTSKWSGGSTKELAIFPEGSKYIERDFIWRLSSATVDTEESTFTRLPDYDRVLLVLKGKTILVHGNERSVSLNRFEQDSFDGAAKTKSFGKITDYNLMMKKGCEGGLEMISLKGESYGLPIPGRDASSCASFGFFCAEGHTVVSVGGEVFMIKEGEQMIIDFDEGESEEIVLMGEGRCVASHVFFTVSKHMAEIIPEEKASFNDFKTAFRLVYSRNKWNKVRQKTGNANIWYDEVLQKKLKFIEKTYITFFIWILGMLGTLVPIGFGAETKTTVIIFVLWTLIYVLLIAPLVYMIILPKPINAHIKDVGSLTEYERGIYEKQLGEDERLEKLLKKYKERDEEDETYRDKLKGIFK